MRRQSTIKAPTRALRTSTPRASTPRSRTCRRSSMTCIICSTMAGGSKNRARRRSPAVSQVRCSRICARCGQDSVPCMVSQALDHLVPAAASAGGPAAVRHLRPMPELSRCDRHTRRRDPQHDLRRRRTDAGEPVAVRRMALLDDGPGGTRSDLLRAARHRIHFASASCRPSQRRRFRPGLLPSMPRRDGPAPISHRQGQRARILC